MEEILKQNSKPYIKKYGALYTQCPVCMPYVNGEPVLSLLIDNFINSANNAWCDACGGDFSKEEILLALGIYDESFKNDIDNAQRIWSIKEILNHDFGEVEWLVENIIPKQGITALSGNPGDFKTWLTIHIALAVTNGTSVFNNFKTTKGNILIIDEEDNLRLLKKRLISLGAKENDNIFYLSQSGIKVDDEKNRELILSIIKANDIKLIILDSLVRIHQQDENDAKGMSKVFSNLFKLTSTGPSILFTHHHRKQIGFGSSNPGQSMRGSSDILAAVDCHLTLEKKKDEDILVVRQSKLRQAEQLQPFELRIEKGIDGPTGFEYVGTHNDKEQKVDEAVAALVAVLKEGMMSRPDVQDALGEEFGRNTIDEASKRAVVEGQIEKVPRELLPKGERKVFYRLASTSELPASLSLIGVGNRETQLEDEEILF